MINCQRYADRLALPNCMSDAVNRNSGLVRFTMFHIWSISMERRMRKKIDMVTKILNDSLINELFKMMEMKCLVMLLNVGMKDVRMLIA